MVGPKGECGYNETTPYRQGRVVAAKTVQEHYENIRQDVRVRQLKGRPIASLWAAQARALRQAFSVVAGFLPTPLRHPLQPWAGKTHQERSRLVAQDHRLVSLLVSRGHLQIAPALMDTDSTSTERSSFMFYGGLPGKVRLQSHPDGSAVAFKNVSDATLSRWLVLLHEVAHQELELETEPFRPTQGSVPTEVVQALSQWVLGQSGMASHAQRTLSECFADAYAAMLLLSNLEGPAQAAAERQIHALHEHRTKDGKVSHELYVELVTEEGRVLQPLDEHNTAPALERMWETRAQWQGLPPAALKAFALKVASDGWVQAMGEEFQSPQGFPLGMAYRLSLLVQTPLERLSENVKMRAVSYLAGANATVAHHDWSGTPPVVQRWMQLVEKELEASVEKAFPGVRRLHLQGEGERAEVATKALHQWSDAFTQAAFESKNLALRQAGVDIVYAHHQAQRALFEQWIQAPFESQAGARNYPVLTHALSEWKAHFQPAPWEAAWVTLRSAAFAEQSASLPRLGAWREDRTPLAAPPKATRSGPAL